MEDEAPLVVAAAVEAAEVEPPEVGPAELTAAPDVPEDAAVVAADDDVAEDPLEEPAVANATELPEVPVEGPAALELAMAAAVDPAVKVLPAAAALEGPAAPVDPALVDELVPAVTVAELRLELWADVPAVVALATDPEVPPSTMGALRHAEAVRGTANTALRRRLRNDFMAGPKPERSGFIIVRADACVLAIQQRSTLPCAARKSSSSMCRARTRLVEVRTETGSKRVRISGVYQPGATP